MNRALSYLIAATAFVVLSGCVSVKNPRSSGHRSTQTTTESTTLSTPRSTTVETQSTRTY